MIIRRDDLNKESGNEQVIELLKNHLNNMQEQSPPGSVHALDLSGLQSPSISFWSAWIDGELAGCGALKEHSGELCELKSMRTSERFLRRGVARKLLEYILDVARNRGYRRISLETGSMEAFAPARRLYETFGFVNCPPFADYTDDPNSICMTKVLSSLSQP